MLCSSIKDGYSNSVMFFLVVNFMSYDVFLVKNDEVLFRVEEGKLDSF